jgi:hypothetical protein
MSASLQSQQSVGPFSDTTNESSPSVQAHRSFRLVVRDLARTVWLALRRFVAEALEEHGKLYEKSPYGWWI